MLFENVRYCEQFFNDFRHCACFIIDHVQQPITEHVVSSSTKRSPVFPHIHAHVFHVRVVFILIFFFIGHHDVHDRDMKTTFRSSLKVTMDHNVTNLLIRALFPVVRYRFVLVRKRTRFFMRHYKNENFKTEIRSYAES